MGGKGLWRFGAIWLLAALPFGWAGWYMLKTEGLYEREGVTVDGTVTDLRVEVNSSYDRDTRQNKRTETHRVYFKFQTEGGQALEGNDTLDRQTWTGLNKGSPIEVQYLEDKPQNNRIARPSSFVGGYLFCAFSGLALLIGLGSIYYSSGEQKQTNRLMQSGVSTEGTVTRAGPGTVSVNGVVQWQVAYSYKDVKGREFKGTTRHMTPEKAQAWRVGDRGAVRYDPGKPHKSLWVGKA